jgi:hypothetical protein
MPKGRRRHHRTARAMKRSEPDVTGTANLCEECSRDPHADWCLADAPDDVFDNGPFDDRPH